MITIYGREMFTTLEELVDPAYTALLLVDIQNGFCSPDGYLAKEVADMSMLELAPSRVKPVLEAARRYGVFVIHIQNTLYPKRVAESGAWLRMVYIRRVMSYGLKAGVRTEVARKTEEPTVLSLATTLEGTYDWQIVDEVAPQPGEIVVKKHRSSAFIGTDLDMILRSNGIKSVVSVGVATEGCVESTARDAQFFDYYSIVLRDCVGTDSHEIHEAALLVMSTRMDVVDSAEVIDVWAKKGAASSTEAET